MVRTVRYLPSAFIPTFGDERFLQLSFEKLQ